MSERVDYAYRGYRIIADVVNGRPGAAVLQGKRKVFGCDGATVAEATERAKAELNRLIEERNRRRREPHIGTAEEYVAAFRELKVAPHHAAMLRAHANAPDRTMTAGELAHAAGYDSYASANAHYGKLGRAVAEFLDIPPPESDLRDEPVWTKALADAPKNQASESRPDAQFRWQMHTEVSEALRSLNMA